MKKNMSTIFFCGDYFLENVTTCSGHPQVTLVLQVTGMYMKERIAWCKIEFLGRKLSPLHGLTGLPCCSRTVCGINSLVTYNLSVLKRSGPVGWLFRVAGMKK